MNASPVVVRKLISQIPANQGLTKYLANMHNPLSVFEVQKFFEAIHLLGLRVGEACASKTPRDKSNATGHTLAVKLATYKPDRRNRLEIRTLQEILQDESNDTDNPRVISRADVLAVEESAAVFSVQVEKRKDLFVRKTMIPLNPVYEPFAQGVLTYILEKQKEKKVPFNWNRHVALRLARLAFKGYTYEVKAYRAKTFDEHKQPLFKMVNGSKKFLRETIPYHTKTFGDHAIRHKRIEELKTLGIRGHLLTAFLGWTPKGEDSLEDLYAGDTFRAYMPYLLVKQERDD
jgi:hypothetical protein